MRLNTALEEKTLDRRLRDKLLAEGKLTKEQVAKYEKDLKDDAFNVLKGVRPESMNGFTE